jgi:hypothetical protein
VERVRRHRELLGGAEHDLARGRVHATVCACRARLWVRRGIPFHVQIDHARPNPERFLLARRAVERRMAMLRARLVREQHDVFRAHALGVDVDDDLGADLLQDVEPEVDDFDAFLFP